MPPGGYNQYQNQGYNQNQSYDNRGYQNQGYNTYQGYNQNYNQGYDSAGAYNQGYSSNQGKVFIYSYIILFIIN